MELSEHGVAHNDVAKLRRYSSETVLSKNMGFGSEEEVY